LGRAGSDLNESFSGAEADRLADNYNREAVPPFNPTLPRSGYVGLE